MYKGVMPVEMRTESCGRERLAWAAGTRVVREERATGVQAWASGAGKT
jgi:hypothetical protein